MKDMPRRRRRAGHLCPCPGVCGPGEERKATSPPACSAGAVASAGAWPFLFSSETWIKSADAAHSPWNAREAAEEAGGRRESGGKGLTITPKHRV